VAWVLVRYEFPGKRLLDAAVDLPFALPTAVAGIALTALYATNGWLGSLPVRRRTSRSPTHRSAFFVALAFIGVPFVVRTVQPVLVRTSTARSRKPSATLGATRTGRRVARRPAGAHPRLCSPAFALAFARAVGEYGSVIFIAGNMPFVSEIAPLLIVTRLEEFDYAGAAAIATGRCWRFHFVMLLADQHAAGMNRRAEVRT
jgi:sulfate transport system permease protein